MACWQGMLSNTTPLYLTILFMVTALFQFIRDELKATDKNSSNLFGNDTQISVSDLWNSWIASEGNIHLLQSWTKVIEKITIKNFKNTFIFTFLGYKKCTPPPPKAMLVEKKWGTCCVGPKLIRGKGDCYCSK